MATYDQDNLDSESFLIFLCSTWTDGEPPESARGFYLWLKDFAMDFRVSKSLLQNTRYAVFGFGHSSYDKAFCSWVFELDKLMESLGAERLNEIACGDDATGAEKKFNKWNKPVVLGILDALREQQPVEPEVPAIAARKVRSKPKPVQVKVEPDNDEMKPEELEAEDKINEAYLLVDGKQRACLHCVLCVSHALTEIWSCSFD
jgi:sulfite reductase alpha subunit-like flavoprotein